MIFGNKVVKIEIFAQNGTLLAAAEKNFVFPKEPDSGDDNIAIVKGRDLPELERGTRVVVIAYTRAGDRVRYLGDISVSHERQMNVALIRANGNQVLEERRRFFKIKVSLDGRLLFVVRDDKTIRFDEPYQIEVHDINVGGVFITCPYELQKDDCVCVDIELLDEYRLNTMARILRVQKDEAGTLLGYGCAFESLTAAQEDAIGKYINHQQLLKRAKQFGEEN